MVIVVIAIAAVWTFFLKPELPDAERGRRIAEREGCFACHGLGGIGGVPNPGSKLMAVPGFIGDTHDADEVREWIRDGAPAHKLNDPEWQLETERAALVMPAFEGVIGDEDIEYLVAYVVAIGGMQLPNDEQARLGFERAQALGCFGCHGWGGRLAQPNPRSLKGYIPPWDGNDFKHLCRDREEFEQWVRNGISDRVRGSSFSNRYVSRANVKMPAYDQHLQPGDVDALWAYVQWLRRDLDE